MAAGGTLLFFVSLYCLFILPLRPSNDRTWSVDQAVLPEVGINGDLVTVRNVRNFDYTSADAYEPAYYDRTYDLTELKKLWYVVEPFSANKSLAHTFLSFEFEDDVFLAVSVEIRKEVGESFSALKGMFRKYELMYVIADERDVIKLRSNFRHDDVYVYPTTASKESVRRIFLDMMERAGRLSTEPEFYHSLLNTCTTNIVAHINAIAEGSIPFHRAIFLPGHSDALAYELGLIDTSEPLENLRRKYRINEKASQHADAPDFSVKIRQ